MKNKGLFCAYSKIMILTDTHTHIYYEEDSFNRAELINRCLQNEVTRLFLPNVDQDSIAPMSSLVDTYPTYCFPMIGLHPCSVKDDYLIVLKKMYEYASRKNYVAIGEIGIDLYHDRTFLEQQKHTFSIQLNWAIELNLPIAIHCRNAFEEVYQILKFFKGNIKGIFHCFSGSLEQAKRIIDLGFYLGIGGVLTYKNSGLVSVVEEVALTNIVLETDAPYLTPVPHRGKPNESAYLIYVAEKIADIKGTSIQEVADITTQNSVNIFGV